MVDAARRPAEAHLDVGRSVERLRNSLDSLEFTNGGLGEADGPGFAWFALDEPLGLQRAEVLVHADGFEAEALGDLVVGGGDLVSAGIGQHKKEDIQLAPGDVRKRLECPA